MYTIMYIMNTKTTLSISKARKDIFKIADDIEKTAGYYTLTENGKPKVVLMSAAEFELWQETFDVMKDFPNLEKDIELAEKEYRAGKFTTVEKYFTHAIPR